MALRFLADRCISNASVKALREANHEVLRLREVLPVESPDSAVIAKAQAIGAIVLSLNGDSGDIVTYPPGNYAGIVTLQMRNHPENLPRLLARLIGYLQLEPNMEHYRGKLLVIEVERIRIRH